ncbi:unnamed protein product, partial [Arabidopsis halleri]
IRSHNSTIEQGPSFVFVFLTVEPPLVELVKKIRLRENLLVGPRT